METWKTPLPCICRAAGSLCCLHAVFIPPYGDGGPTPPDEVDGGITGGIGSGSGGGGGGGDQIGPP